jgi:tetratricopeptide (TPR) repeat protein
VILLSATDPWLAHSAALLTTEGYALLRARLNEGGVVAQRLSLSAAAAPAERAILRTFAHAFPSVLVFQLTPDDLLLIGSDAPRPLDAASTKNLLASNGGVADDLRRSVIVGPNEIVMTVRLGGDALRKLMGEGPINDDEHNVVSVMAAADLAVHRNDAIAREIDAAWSGLEGLVTDYGATPSEQSDYLYSLAKSYLGLTADPVRALGVAQQLAALGETARSRWVTGEARLQQKDIDGALGEWEAVLAADPKNLDALFSLGTFYLDGRDYLRADKYLSRAATLYGDTPVVLYHDGRNQFNLGRYDRAITELQKARDLGGGSNESYPLVDYFVGLAASRLKRDDLASRSLQDYLKWAYAQSVLTRVEVDAHLKLADVYDRQGKRFEGLQERRKASSLRQRIEAYARLHPEAAGGPTSATDVPEAGAPAAAAPEAGAPPAAPPESPAPAPKAAPGSDAH